MMRNIINVHYPDLEQNLIHQALKTFYALRDIDGLMKKPSTSELLDWIQALVLGGIHPQRIEKEIPYLGVLIKKDEDFDKVEQYLNKSDGHIYHSSPYM